MTSQAGLDRDRSSLVQLVLRVCRLNHKVYDAEDLSVSSTTSSDHGSKGGLR